MLTAAAHRVRRTRDAPGSVGRPGGDEWPEPVSSPRTPQRPRRRRCHRSNRDLADPARVAPPGPGESTAQDQRSSEVPILPDFKPPPPRALGSRAWPSPAIPPDSGGPSRSTPPSAGGHTALRRGLPADDGARRPDRGARTDPQRGWSKLRNVYQPYEEGRWRAPVWTPTWDEITELSARRTVTLARRWPRGSGPHRRH